MIRRTAATAAGGVLLLVGGYFLLHNAFGFVLPQITFELPQINWADVSAVVAGTFARVGWNLLWPTLAVILGLLLLSRGRASAGSR